MESLQAEVKSEHPCKERWSQNIPARRGEVRTVNINFFINGNTIDTNYSVCIMYPGTWVSVNSFIQNRVTLPNMKNASQDCKRMQYQFCTRSLQMLEKQICGYNWTKISEKRLLKFFEYSPWNDIRYILADFSLTTRASIHTPTAWIVWYANFQSQRYLTWMTTTFLKLGLIILTVEYRIIL